MYSPGRSAPLKLSPSVTEEPSSATNGSSSARPSRSGCASPTAARTASTRCQRSSAVAASGDRAASSTSNRRGRAADGDMRGILGTDLRQATPGESGAEHYTSQRQQAGEGQGGDAGQPLTQGAAQRHHAADAHQRRAEQ